MARDSAAHKALEAVVMQPRNAPTTCLFSRFVAFGGVDGPGYKPIADVFTGLGWQERDTFELENGLVTARWYQPPSVDFPMVVVRELRVDRFGEECVEVCDKFVDDANNAGEETTRAAALTGGTPWRIEPGEDDLEVLGYYSPLLAWHLSHGYAAHAVAASVTGLAKVGARVREERQAGGDSLARTGRERHRGGRARDVGAARREDGGSRGGHVKRRVNETGIHARRWGLSVGAKWVGRGAVRAEAGRRHRDGGARD